MRYQVRLTDDAAVDIEEIFLYVARNDSLSSAEAVLRKLEDAIARLALQPNRGVHPQELLELGIREYREVFFKPYRIIYRVIKRFVYVYLIADGRRDMQSLLRRRLLEADRG